MDENEFYDERENDEQENSDEEGEQVGYDHEESYSDEEEEEEEEDEEEARKIAEGFIVDDDDEEDQESDASQKVAVRRRKRKKVEDFDAELDEEDLDLLEENTGLKLNRESGPKLKRLKRGREEKSHAASERTAEEFFSDEEVTPKQPEYRRRATYDDMDDFIAEEDEENEPEDEGPGSHYYDEEQRRSRPAKDMLSILPEGLSEDVLADMYDIFGDGADYEWALYDEEEMRADKEPREPQLADVFEPSELAERMLTDKDEEIRLRDIPERMQLDANLLKEPTPAELEEESLWIATKLTDMPQESIIESVKLIVTFLRREFLEVPFIAEHRRDFTNGLSTDQLWAIHDYDIKFRSFASRRAALREVLRDEYAIDMLNSAESIEEINDLAELPAVKEAQAAERSTQLKRPVKRSIHDDIKDQLKAILPHFGITASQFGTNYYERSRRYYPEDSLVTPEEEARQCVGGALNHPDKVLMAARSLIAQQFASDPQVRKAMRHDWDTNAVVDIKPTEKGFTIIDELHPVHPFKYVHMKPVSTFTDGQFLQILKYEKDGLLTMNIRIAGYDAWFNQIADYYLSDGYSDAVQRWNEQRKLVLTQALNEHLIPLMEKYVREKQRLAAQEAVCNGARQSLQNKVNIGPFRGPGANRYKNGIPRVVAVSSGNGDFNDPVCAVSISSKGRLVDKIQVGNLRDERNAKELAAFLIEKKPNVVGVAGYNNQARHVLKHLQTIVSDVNRNPEMNGSTVDLVVVDDETARLYKNSKLANEEYGELPEVMRYCISLARRLQCPVLEYTGLGRDLLTLRHHPLQRLVPQDMLLMHLERALVNVVNDMGIDINLAVSSPYHATALQYICGLGPRKAQNVLKKIEARGELESRAALVTRGLTPAITFMNCASFVRIRDVDGADILDDTRIHPQDYELARKMAGDALEIDEDEMDDFESKVAIVTRVIKEFPDKLNDLILDDYAVVLQRQYNAPKRQILEHIKEELQGPFRDRRQRYARPTVEETFAMVTGETSTSLREGFIVSVKITALRGKIANCVMDSGLEGVIYVDNVADHRVMNVGDVLRPGITINAKVLHIDREKFVVDLSCKPSDTQLNSDMPIRKLPDDPYYDHAAEAQELERRRALQRKQATSRRVVNHPLFQQFNYKQAEEYLSSRQRGDLVIRPSSRGLDHIAITWKVDDGVYQHIDVVELKQPGAAFGAVQYKVDDQVFDDLDQLIVMFVEAIAAKAEELMGHAKFRSGGPSALQGHLKTQTMANPRFSAYGFCQSDKPGYFDLIFMLNSKTPPASWPVKLLPNGYRLRGTLYPGVDALIDGFKRLQMSEARRHRGGLSRQHERPVMKK